MKREETNGCLWFRALLLKRSPADSGF